jgi:hypothetical protein
MYDGTDVAMVLGWLLSAGLGGLSLIVAAVVLGLFVARRSRREPAAASRPGRLAVAFSVGAALCGLSIPTGLAIYNLFEHQRGYTNPPAHVLSVAIASVSGPVAASIFALAWLLRRRKKEAGGEPNRGHPGAAADRPRA